MLVLSVAILVKPEHREEFIQATLENARGTRSTEKGNLRFDVLQSEDDPNRFMLYEVYRDAEAHKAHGQTPHYLRWQQTVKDWMAAPRERTKLHPLHPGDDPAAW